MTGIGPEVWWMFRNGQEFLGPETDTSAPLPQPVPMQATSEPQEPTAPMQIISGPRGPITPTPPRVSNRQSVPIKPRKFGDFKIKGTGSSDTVTYRTAKEGRFFIANHLPSGSIEVHIKGLKGVKPARGVTYRTNSFGGYKCFPRVHGGIGRTTMGPSGTPGKLAEINETFCEVRR